MAKQDDVGRGSDRGEEGSPGDVMHAQTRVIRGELAAETQPAGEHGGDGSAYATRLRRRELDTYEVTEDELSSIDIQHSQASSLFSFASLALGGLLSTALTWGTGHNWALLSVLTVTALAFGAMGLWVLRTRNTLLDRIKEQTRQSGG